MHRTRHEEMIIRLRKERSRVTSITKYEQKEQVFSNASLLKEKTVSLNLSTRFSQLRVATTLELWQEAWKIVEDITSLMQRSAYIRPNMLMEYYDRVAQVFWMSHNHKFHLYALLKEFNVARTPGLNISSDSWTLYVAIAFLFPSLFGHLGSVSQILFPSPSLPLLFCPSFFLRTSVGSYFFVCCCYYCFCSSISRYLYSLKPLRSRRSIVSFCSDDGQLEFNR